MDTSRRIAYFCMEVGYQATMPTYTGGLGILAGDTLRSAADLRLPMVAVTLLHRRGYFRQILDASGGQAEEPERWSVGDFLKETSIRVTVTIEGRTVHVRAWQFDIVGATGYRLPLYFLDTQLQENSDFDRTLTDHLYGGDPHYRLCQEVVLGIGGVRVLRAMGCRSIEKFHMNEGHAALLAAELLDERARHEDRQDVRPEDVELVRRQCVFTTHTPVPAGHDEFPAAQAEAVLEGRLVQLLSKVGVLGSSLNMTHLALKLSGHVNGVSRRHGEVSRRMFNQPVDSVTNGVHARTWVSPRLAELFDKYLPLWREETFSLRLAMRVPVHELWGAHVQAKIRLLDYVSRTAGVVLDPDLFTIGFARRMAAYKRADVFLHDLGRLKQIHSTAGPIQIIYAGKAHPRDMGAKEIIRKVFAAKEAAKPEIKMAFLSNYDMQVGALMTAGVDLWLNTPEPPMEASGTSGMKAAMNGVPSLSVLDGWWVEGCIENVTGWAIGRDRDGHDVATDRARTAEMIYDKLEHVILPMYYHDRHRFLDVMRHAIAINGSYFSTQRMVHQYAIRAYFH